MTRVRISAVILLILILSGSFMSIWVNRRCDDMLGDLNRLSIMAENGQTEALSESARELNKKWESFRRRASFLVRYDKLVEADRISARIVQLSEYEGEELKAELAELRELRDMLKSGETPLLSSVF